MAHPAGHDRLGDWFERCQLCLFSGPALWPTGGEWRPGPKFLCAGCPTGDKRETFSLPPYITFKSNQRAEASLSSNPADSGFVSSLPNRKLNSNRLTSRKLSPPLPGQGASSRAFQPRLGPLLNFREVRAITGGQNEKNRFTD